MTEIATIYSLYPILQDENGEPGKPCQNTHTGIIKSVDHVFNNPEHNLTTLLDTFNGNMYQAYYNVYTKFSEVAGKYTVDQLTKGIPLRINGIDIIVRGTIVDGIARLSTAFIPPVTIP